MILESVRARDFAYHQEGNKSFNSFYMDTSTINAEVHSIHSRILLYHLIKNNFSAQVQKGRFMCFTVRVINAWTDQYFMRLLIGIIIINI